MSRLTNIMEYHLGGSTKQQKILNSYSFPEDMKTLLLGETNESADLVKREVIGALVEGAESRRSTRLVIPTINTNSNTCRVIYGSSPSGQYVDYVGEGAKIPQMSNTYSKTDISTKKAAIRPNITNELIEDSMFDIIELEIRRAGALLENTLNREVMSTLLDGTTNSVDPIDTYTGLQPLGRAKGTVDENGWMADSAMIEPVNFAYMFDQGSISDILNGNNIFGLRSVIVDCNTTGITDQWDGTDAANHYGGLVFDSYNYAAIAMREDINIRGYKDPIQDLIGAVVGIRFGVGIFNANAGCKVLTKTKA